MPLISVVIGLMLVNSRHVLMAVAMRPHLDGLPVWKQLLGIPIGTTISYGEVARRIGNAGAARAVGLANGANPVPIIVPCHRVIGASGALTGYGGGLPRKTWLLEHEQRHWGPARTFDFE